MRVLEICLCLRYTEADIDTVCGGKRKDPALSRASAIHHYCKPAFLRSKQLIPSDACIINPFPRRAFTPLLATTVNVAAVKGVDNRVSTPQQRPLWLKNYASTLAMFRCLRYLVLSAVLNDLFRPHPCGRSSNASIGYTCCKSTAALSRRCKIQYQSTFGFDIHDEER